MLRPTLLHAGVSIRLLNVTVLGVVVLRRKIIVHKIVTLRRIQNG